MKTFLLKITPYIIALFAGVVVYLYAIELKDDNLNNLLINVAAGLVSVPLVFMCYEVINEICSRNIKKTLLEHLSFEVNYIIIDIIKNLKDILGISGRLDEKNLNDFLDTDEKTIKEKLKIDISLADSLKNYKQQLLNLIYKDSNMEVLPNDQIQNLLVIAKELGIISRELDHYNKTRNKEPIESATYNLMQSTGDWVNYCEQNSILQHSHFKSGI